MQTALGEQVLVSYSGGARLLNYLHRWAERAGLDPLRFAGHSLRVGFATSAVAGGVCERAIMDQTGHRSLTMVRRYSRDGELFRNDNAARGAGLQRRPVLPLTSSRSPV
jgi:integrase